MWVPKLLHSLVSWLFVQRLFRFNKTNLYYWPFVWDTTVDWWLHHIKGHLCRKCLQIVFMERHWLHVSKLSLSSPLFKFVLATFLICVLIDKCKPHFISLGSHQPYLCMFKRELMYRVCISFSITCCTSVIQQSHNFVFIFFIRIHIISRIV